MTDSEKLDLLLAEMQGVNQCMVNLELRMANLELHLENSTDKNIQILAENFIELTNKLAQAIPVADKNLAYEIKVNYLAEKVNKLEKEITDLKNKIA